MLQVPTRRGKTSGSGLDWVNQVCGSNGSRVKTGHFLTGQSSCRSIGSRVESGRESGRVDLYFSNKIFFFEIDAICQLFMSSLTMIRFSLVILLPITSKHFT